MQVCRSRLLEDLRTVWWRVVMCLLCCSNVVSVWCIVETGISVLLAAVASPLSSFHLETCSLSHFSFSSYYLHHNRLGVLASFVTLSAEAEQVSDWIFRPHSHVVQCQCQS